MIMKNRRQRAKQVRQRKVAILAAYSKEHSVNNCTIPKVEKDDLIEKKVKWGVVFAVKRTAEWDIPKEGFSQPKHLRKKYKKKYYFKGTHNIRKIIQHSSDYDLFEKYPYTLPKMNCVEYMEKLVQHKTSRWERKNPCPVNENSNPPDIFAKEFLEPWKAKRDLAIERIRDFVVSIYDKLPLSGRFKKTDNIFVEEKVAEIKDIEMEGHKVNELDPKKSKLLKKVQKKTNEIKEKRSNLVCTNLKDHKRQKGRIILPKAA